MNEILKDDEKKKIIEEIKKHSYILPEWLKIKPPIGWNWQIKRNY